LLALSITGKRLSLTNWYKGTMIGSFPPSGTCLIRSC